MNIHKFNAKPKTTLLKTIQWRPFREVKYPVRKVNPMTWEIFSQQEIKLDPKEVEQIRLGLGFIMSEGVVLVALAYSLKYIRCSLQNEVNLENVEDIVITLIIIRVRSLTSRNTNFYVAFVTRNYHSNCREGCGSYVKYAPIFLFSIKFIDKS